MISYTYNRYLWLLNTLLIHKRLNFEELQNKWEHSTMYEGKPLNLRTFHMHRNAVEEMFQVIIECDTSDGSRYYIEAPTSFAKDKTCQWLLNSFNVAGILKQGQAMQNRILLEDITEGTEYLSMIIEAMQKNKELELVYQPFYDDVSTTYHIQPYCMKVYNQRWYVPGKFNEIGELRHFALDRTMSMEMTDVGFKYPKKFSPEEYYSDTIDIWVNDKIKPEKVVIRAYGIQSKYLQSLPLHHSQQEIAKTTEYIDYKYHVCVTRDLVYELLSKGDGLEVLEPESLINQLFDIASSIIKRYKTNK